MFKFSGVNLDKKLSRTVVNITNSHFKFAYICVLFRKWGNFII